MALVLDGFPRVMNKVDFMPGNPTPPNPRAANPRAAAIRSSAWRDLPSARFAIAFSLFLALLATSFLVDGHAVFETLQSAVTPEEQKHVGEVIYSLPDHAYCRHMSFDNETSQLAAGNVTPCPRDASGRHQTEFLWGGH
jgi:hypothetical protein